MLRTALASAIGLSLIAPSLAQAPAPASHPQPIEQALSAKLMEELNANIQYRAALTQARDQIADLQKQLADLQAKSPKDAPKK
jgi:TolA-binding protein